MSSNHRTSSQDLTEYAGIVASSPKRTRAYSTSRAGFQLQDMVDAGVTHKRIVEDMDIGTYDEVNLTHELLALLSRARLQQHVKDALSQVPALSYINPLHGSCVLLSAFILYMARQADSLVDIRNLQCPISDYSLTIRPELPSMTVVLDVITTLNRRRYTQIFRRYTGVHGLSATERLVMCALVCFFCIGEHEIAPSMVQFFRQVTIPSLSDPNQSELLRLHHEGYEAAYSQMRHQEILGFPLGEVIMLTNSSGPMRRSFSSHPSGQKRTRSSSVSMPATATSNHTDIEMEMSSASTLASSSDELDEKRSLENVKSHRTSSSTGLQTSTQLRSPLPGVKTSIDLTQFHVQFVSAGYLRPIVPKSSPSQASTGT